ncbi:MAG: isoprenylcysteine carboxylmethyltransferase family protein [Pseudomonadota bacterium]
MFRFQPFAYPPVSDFRTGYTMLIKQLLTLHGNFLFRWRSYLPLLLLPVFVAAAPESVRVEQAMVNGWSAAWTCICLAVAFLGLAIRVAVVGYVPAGTSGRNVHEQRAEHLNTTGLYSVVRNPLYLGNFVGLIGFVAATRVWWLAVIGSLVYWLYIERIIAAEEEFLERKFGKQYVDWASKTPAFMPRLSGWTKPNMPFSLRTVLRREYNGLFTLGAVFFMWSAFVDLIIENKSVSAWVHEDYALMALFLATFGAFVVLRFLKKHSRLLHEPGR